MEGIPGDSWQSEPRHFSGTWSPSNSKQDLFIPREYNMNVAESVCNIEQSEVTLQTASQILWSTGSLSSQIHNGFYSVIPSKKLKDHFYFIPSPDELHSLGMDGLKADIILIDLEKDKKLAMLKHLTAALVKGLNSNHATLIKKIAGLVTDFYKRPDSELSPAKATMEEVSHLIECKGVQLLGQIKNGSCRPRAILFKVLADAVGLESKLVVGLPSDGGIEYTDSTRHMSVVVMLNSMELLVDLMRFPGQLVPFSAKAIFMSHFSAAGDEYVDYDSSGSPHEPGSPLYGPTDRIFSECSSEKNGIFQTSYQQKIEASPNYGSSIRHIMLRSSSAGSRSLSAPNIANAFWRGSRRRAIMEQQHTAPSSPEHPLSRASARSPLYSNLHSSRDFTDDASASRSEGASISNKRRQRRRSISIIPEIGDDIVRAVRAMSETLKQKRLLKDLSDEGLHLHSRNAKIHIDDLSADVSACHLDANGKKSGSLFVADNILRNQINPSQKAVSLPSSPHELSGQSSEISQSADFPSTEDLITTWSKVLHSSPFLNNPLLPFDEWHIDISELTVGARVGIGFFGEVFRGIWHGTDVAIKVFLEQDLTVESMEDFCNEVSIMSRLRHPNVILFLGACMKPPNLSMVTEYMEMGSLYYLIHMSGMKKKLSWRRRLKMLRDICRGLMCMHRMRIVHRDLKSANCLVNKHWVVKICDFGLSRVMTDVQMNDNSSAGTPEWMAPELMRNEPFTEKCDVFSLGVIMWELCTLSRPWEGVAPVQVVHAVANEGARLEIPEGPLGKLISDCWTEPNDRPSCKEVLTRLLDCEYTLC